MQKAYFEARCDVELGDEVKFAGEITTITDIRTIHYLKAGKVEFEFELAASPGYWIKRQDFIYPVIEKLNQERWEKAIAHARKCLEIYKTIPAGILAATLIANDIAKYERGDRNSELLEALEGISL